MHPIDTPAKTILVVDDSPLIINRLIEMLSETPNIGWIRTAGSYAEAIEAIGMHQPGILLLDINLPDKSGIEILRACRVNKSSVKVIMITNQANESYQKLCMKLGADYFIDKSKEFEQIATIISNMSPL
jgi:DNA-binding NarL/FixJ family response regulator